MHQCNIDPAILELCQLVILWLVFGQNLTQHIVNSEFKASVEKQSKKLLGQAKIPIFVMLNHATFSTVNACDEMFLMK